MKRSLVFVLLVAVVVAGSAASANAREHTRTGFFIGFGLGGGNATWDWGSQIDISDSPSEGSGTVNLRLGGAVRDDLILGAEISGWSKTWEDATSTMEFTITFAMTTFSVTYFPSNVGFYVRGGVGLANAVPEVKIGSATYDTNDSGFGLLFASGYEWRLTEKFAMGPQVELAYLGVDGEVFKNPLFIDGSVQFNWYW